MALDTTGRLIKKLPQQSGAGKNGTWQKQEFVLETMEQYPKKACFSVWGDKVELLNKFREGAELKVSFNIESREYNERWYTDLRAWKIETLSAGSGDTESAPPDFPDVDTFRSSGDDDLPF